jgi:hypothetical protein
MKPLVSIVQQTGRQVVVFVRVLERRVLARVDETLRALDGRVQMRLRKLERRRRPGRRPRPPRPRGSGFARKFGRAALGS